MELGFEMVSKNLAENCWFTKASFGGWMWVKAVLKDCFVQSKNIPT
jgi:hypothetical protein